MNSAFYTAVSGMIAFQKDMDLTAHNIANTKTAGYKASRSSFSDLMYSKMDVRSAEEVVGHGVKNQAADIVMEQAGLNQTGYPLDFAIVGSGFFAVERNGEREYTRNGSFAISANNKTGYLVSSGDGGFILDGRGRRIKLDFDNDANAFDIDNLASRLGIYSFDNPLGLARADQSSFKQSEISGIARAMNNNKDADYEIVTNALEFSAVNIGDEMVNVIKAQRAFQMNSRIVKTADEIEEMINNLR